MGLCNTTNHRGGYNGGAGGRPKKPKPMTDEEYKEAIKFIFVKGPLMSIIIILIIIAVFG